MAGREKACGGVRGPADELGSSMIEHFLLAYTSLYASGGRCTMRRTAKIMGAEDLPVQER